MLYDRWRQIARHHAREWAVHELASGRRWTFAGLDRLAGSGAGAHSPMVCPQGRSVDFLCVVLRGWRAGSVVCPLELAQKRPAVHSLPLSCVHLKSTSATTGATRAVVFTEAQLAADAENIVATMGLRSDWPNVAIISLAHSYGFSNLVLPLLLHGIPLVLADSPLPEVLRKAARSRSNLTVPAVPALWRTWHEAHAIPSNIRLAISAGAPLSAALERTIHETTGVKVHNFYGSTECGGIAYDRTAQPRDDEACVGTPLVGVELSVNEQGCLRVRSRAVGETYWPEPAATLSAGQFQTADLAELRGGRVYLQGRLGDQINVAGRKVSPESIERVLVAHELVKDCLVFGVPDGASGRSELIAACVVAVSPVSADRLRQFLLSRLPAWQVPRRWWFVDSLAANERGKLSRAEWRRRYLVAENRSAEST